MQDYCNFFALAPQHPLHHQAERESLRAFPLYLFVLDEQGQLGCLAAGESADILAQVPHIEAFEDAFGPERWARFALFAYLSSSVKVWSWADSLKDWPVTRQNAESPASGPVTEQLALCLCASARDLPQQELEHLGISHWQSFRSLFALSPEWQQGLLCRAKELVYFDSEFAFCSCCGQALHWLNAEFGKECGNCTTQFFPRQDPSVISLIVARPVSSAASSPASTSQAATGEWLLLARNYSFRAQMYSLIAGFVEAGEEMEQALLREAWEEAGVQLEWVQYLRSQAWPQMHSLMAGFLAESDTEPQRSRPNGKEIASLLWLERKDIQRYLHQDARLTQQDKPLLFPLTECQNAYFYRAAAEIAEETAFCLPDRGTIARKLIESWAERS